MNQEIYEVIKNIVKKNEWDYIENLKELGIENMLATNVTTDQGVWVVVMRAIEQENRFICYSVFPTEAVEEKKAEVMKITTKINYGLKIGNFEIDLDSGEVHFKTSIQFPQDFDGNMEEWIEENISINVATMNQYFSQLVSVID